MITHGADGYYVTLAVPNPTGQPTARRLRWGPYAARADAQAVERRNRAVLAGQIRRSGGPQRTRAAQPRLLEDR